MKNKTREVKLWDYLSKKLDNPKLAKEVYHRVVRDFTTKTRKIKIRYNVDTEPLKQSLAMAKEINKELAKMKKFK